MMNRRNFIKRGALFVPTTFGIFVPQLIRAAQPFLSNRRGAFKAPAGGGGPAYMLTQDWESGSEPSGWSHVGTGVNYNYTTTVLDGAKSMAILGTVDSAAQAAYAAQNAAWHLFRFRITALPGAVINGLGITDTGLNAIAFVGVNASGTLTVNLVGGGSSTTVSAIAANTTYWIKQSFTKGSPGVATVEFSTTGTFIGSGNAFATTSLNPDNTSPGGISLENYSSGNTWIFDHVRVYNSDLGNSGSWP